MSNQNDIARFLTTEEAYEGWEREWWERQRRWRLFETWMCVGFAIAVVLAAFFV